jgi:signal peptidase I
LPENNNSNNSDRNDDDDSSTTKNVRRRHHHKQKKKKSSSKRADLIPIEVKYVIIGLAAAAIIGLGFKVVLQVNNPFYIVSSESMVPTLMVGDVVVLRNGANGSGFSFSDLKAGDIIVFHTEDGGGRTIVHRIAEIYQKDSNNGAEGHRAGGGGGGSERLLKTKGDNNPISYEILDYPIKDSDYYGKVIFVIPKVGLVFKALSTPPLSYVIIIILAAAVVAIVSMSIIISGRRYRKRLL